MAEHFHRIVLIDRLRETRGLVGFERIVPEMPTQIEERKKLLRNGGPNSNRRLAPCRPRVRRRNLS